MAARSIRRAEILRVAVSILDSGGIPALAMRRIANELGIQQSALYWHFDSKQELLAGLADQILEHLAPPVGQVWQERVTDLALTLRSRLLTHRDGAELVATVFAFRLGATGPLRGFAGELIQAGLTREDAETAASVLLHFVLGFTTNEQQHAQAARLGAIDAESDAGDDLGRQFTTDRFVRGVAIIVAGVQTQLDSILSVTGQPQEGHRDP